MATILSKRALTSVTKLFIIEAPLIAAAARPGQFVIVRVREGGERIPLTIADFDRAKGTITLVIQAVGKTTKEIQRNFPVGSALFGVVGPMGTPSAIGEENKVICVGGGLGVAPVFPQARAFKEKGAYVIGVIGFRNESLVFWKDKFESVCDEFIICSDDGSVGIKGLVTDGIEMAVAKHDDIDEVIAIGPPIMMKAAAETTREHGIKTTVSLNPIMVDGTGMCGGCRVLVGDETKFACVDGPDFAGHEVALSALMNHLTRFKADEAEATERWASEADQPAALKSKADASAPQRRAVHGDIGVHWGTIKDNDGY